MFHASAACLHDTAKLSCQPAVRWGCCNTAALRVVVHRRMHAVFVLRVLLTNSEPGLALGDVAGSGLDVERISDRPSF
jgi:hypothetical protein